MSVVLTVQVAKGSAALLVIRGAWPTWSGSLPAIAPRIFGMAPALTAQKVGLLPRSSRFPARSPPHAARPGATYPARRIGGCSCSAAPARPSGRMTWPPRSVLAASRPDASACRNPMSPSVQTCVHDALRLARLATRLDRILAAAGQCCRVLAGDHWLSSVVIGCCFLSATALVAACGMDWCRPRAACNPPTWPAGDCAWTGTRSGTSRRWVSRPKARPTGRGRGRGWQRPGRRAQQIGRQPALERSGSPSCPLLPTPAPGGRDGPSTKKRGVLVRGTLARGASAPQIPGRLISLGAAAGSAGAREKFT